MGCFLITYRYWPGFITYVFLRNAFLRKSEALRRDLDFVFFCVDIGSKRLQKGYLSGSISDITEVEGRCVFLGWLS